MTPDTDEKFYTRADAHINLANGELAGASRGKVSASMMFAASRFNAWVSAHDFESGEEMASKRQEITEYFIGQYRAMLDTNLDNYIENFDAFMNPNAAHNKEVEVEK
jgi:PPE-repeat protein